jgi:hypothetical protein
LLFCRKRRAGYQYKEQSPSDHTKNLERYLLIASSLIPRDPTLSHFRIRHPGVHQSNIIVRRSSNSGWQVISLLDWQHASILPLFLLAGIPQCRQNYDDTISQSMTPPSLPENFDQLEEAEPTTAMEVFRCRLGYYRYVTNTAEYNKPHYDALRDPMYMLRSRLFEYAGYRWEGETLELKVALIQAVLSREVGDAYSKGRAVSSRV